MEQVGTLGGGAGAARRGTWTTRAPATSAARATAGPVWYTGCHNRRGVFMQGHDVQRVTDNVAEVCYLSVVISATVVARLRDVFVSTNFAS